MRTRKASCPAHQKAMPPRESERKALAPQTTAPASQRAWRWRCGLSAASPRRSVEARVAKAARWLGLPKGVRNGSWPFWKRWRPKRVEASASAWPKPMRATATPVAPMPAARMRRRVRERQSPAEAMTAAVAASEPASAAAVADGSWESGRQPSRPRGTRAKARSSARGGLRRPRSAGGSGTSWRAERPATARGTAARGGTTRRPASEATRRPSALAQRRAARTAAPGGAPPSQSVGPATAATRATVAARRSGSVR